jgi:tetratricopeptide (TPR) repeat protein
MLWFISACVPACGSSARLAALALIVLVAPGAARPHASAQTAPTQRPAKAAATDTRLAQAARAFTAGDTARAFDLATAYVRQHPADAAARVLLARVHLDRDELDAAYLQLEQALRTRPRDVDALYYFGLVTSQLAARRLDTLVERAPESARAKQLLAESLEARDRRSEAEAAWEAALAANPTLLDALLGLARLKRIRLDCEGAITLYTRAEAVSPTFDAAYGLGSCYLRQQQLDAALSRFEQAVARDPRAAVARVGLASALLGLTRTTEAIAALQRAIALEPAMGEAWYLLGRAQQASGNRAAAQEAFARAEQLRTGAAAPRER